MLSPGCSLAVVKLQLPLQDVEKFLPIVLEEAAVVPLLEFEFDEERFDLLGSDAGRQGTVEVPDRGIAFGTASAEPDFLSSDEHVLPSVPFILEEEMEPDLEPLGDFEQRRQGRGYLIVLDLGEERFRQAGEIVKVLEGKSTLLPQFPDLDSDPQLPDFRFDVFHG
jgi:hypothetical protein